MRKFTVSLPTPSDLGKVARHAKDSLSKDERLTNRVEKLRTKLDKAVTEFNAAYVAPGVVDSTPCPALLGGALVVEAPVEAVVVTV